MRRAAIILAAVALSLALAACGSSTQTGGSSYQEAYDKGYQAGYQAGRDEHSTASKGDKADGTDRTDTANGSALGDAVDDVGDAIGDAVTDVGDAVGGALGGESTARSRTGSTSTFRRMLNNARVTDTDGLIH